MCLMLAAPVVWRIRLMAGNGTLRDARGANHSCLGKPPFDLDIRKRWLGEIAALDHSFEALEVEK